MSHSSSASTGQTMSRPPSGGTSGGRSSIPVNVMRSLGALATAVPPVSFGLLDGSRRREADFDEPVDDHFVHDVAIVHRTVLDAAQAVDGLDVYKLLRLGAGSVIDANRLRDRFRNDALARRPEAKQGGIDLLDVLVVVEPSEDLGNLVR